MYKILYGQNNDRVGVTFDTDDISVGVSVVNDKTIKHVCLMIDLLVLHVYIVVR